MKNNFELRLLFLLLVTTTITFAQTANDYFAPVKYRNIGPFRGGRSVCATGVIGNPMTYYMGTTGGGLWKTTDAGQHWNNVSDGFFEMGSVGAVAVSESNSNIVYVGMGEHAPRGVMTSYGDGVYKSTDAGKTWNHIGLTETQHISRIRIHPTNPDVVYVAAQGALYGPNQERGIYKSTDGGKTWKNVLFVNALTGCAELAMDANVPEVMYATMWEHKRKPEIIISGGAGSGVFKSVDGGETWNKIEKGLPKEKGKMAISVSAANPNTVYALVESDSNADKGGLFVSKNAGESWSKVSGDNRLTQRAWYYTEVFADPNNENEVYVLSAPALKSIDGGKTWAVMNRTHGDYHDLWINPHNSNNMILADDGGAAITFNDAETWSSLNIMPTAQFYRINADNLFPYHIYGGQQDNTSVKIASLSLGRGSIGRQDWDYSAGGESAFLAFDPDNPRYVMGGSYLGNINLLDTHSKASTKVLTAPIQYLGRAAREMKYLYNWNAPIIWSKHEPGTFYHCAQMVLRTRDMGETWEEISPDLTRNQDGKQGKGGGPYTNEAVGAENYGTIAYMIESPHEKGVFYTGSDDGLVHITKDGGASWEDVSPKGLQECLVNAIEVSPHDAATVYIATTRYKFNDYTPALYKSTNYGKSWTNISNGIPQGAFTRVVREDKDRSDLLYAGTEKGMYISWNGGKAWEPFQLNLPKTPILDLMVHQGDLIVATSGRSFWVLDDLGLLTSYDKPKGDVTLFRPEPAYNGSWNSALNGNSPKFKGSQPFTGVNPANGVVLYYELPKLDSTEISLEIKDSKGKLINSFSSKKDASFKKYPGGPSAAPVLSKKQGLNRFVWDMHHTTLPGVPEAYIEANYKGHRAIPGTYTITLKAGNHSVQTEALIKEVPLYETKSGQYETFDAFMTETEATLTAMHKKVNMLFKAKNQLTEVLTKITDTTLRKEGKALLAEMEAWDNDMVQRKSKAYDDVENFPNKFTAEYLFMINASDSAIPRINKSSVDRREELDAQWAVLKSRAMDLENNKINQFNKKLWAAGIGAVQL